MDLTSPLPLRLHRGSPTPLSVQIAGQVRDLISSATLGTGTRLPSNRALAADLGVARAVVEQAYDQLRAEGWLTSRRGAGTYVAALGRPPAPRAPTVGSAPPAATAAGGPRRIALDTGSPWQDPRLRAGWRRAWRDVAAASLPTGYPDPAGLPELRAELAAYVARTRGVLCRPEEVMVTAGTTHAVGLLLSALGSGTLAVEDPGYRAAVATARQGGWRVLDVPVDRDGLTVEHLAAHGEDDVRAVYVTPAHQHPLGFTLSAGRRVALLAEARRRDALVLEDDYDSEFRYDVAPVPALTALDREQSVYLGTASKLLHPALRIGWLVGPAPLVADLARLRAARHDHPGWPVQRALLTLLGEGHLDKSVRAARRVYAERGARVEHRLGRFGSLTRPVAGMYATLLLPRDVADAVVGDSAAAGVDVPSLSGYSRSSGRSGLVVGFGGVTDDELGTALAVLEQSLERHAR